MAMTETNDKFSPTPPGHDLPRGVGDHDRPDLTDRESQELLIRLGRGLRAIVGDVLLDPVPQRFQRLLDELEHAEMPQRN